MIITSSFEQVVPDPTYHVLRNLLTINALSCVSAVYTQILWNCSFTLKPWKRQDTFIIQSKLYHKDLVLFQLKYFPIQSPRHTRGQEFAHVSEIVDTPHLQVNHLEIWNLELITKNAKQAFNCCSGDYGSPILLSLLLMRSSDLGWKGLAEHRKKTCLLKIQEYDSQKTNKHKKMLLFSLYSSVLR